MNMRKTALSLFVAFFVSIFPLSEFASSEQPKSSKPRGPAYVPGELLVKYRPSMGAALAGYFRTHWGVSNIRTFKSTGVRHVRLPEDMTVEDALEVFEMDPDVLYVEPNYIRRACLMPNDPDFDILWGLHNTGQTGGTHDADIGCPDAWGTQTGSSNVVIAVIDTGVDLDHEDIIDNIWKNTSEDWVAGNPGYNGLDDDGNSKIDDYYGWDFVNGDNNPDDDNAENYHGTHVSGTIGARGDNSLGITGVSWSASIMSIKTLDANGDGSVAAEIEAIDYAINNGAKIINASFGGPQFSQSEFNAVKTARDAGVLFVAAAGNDVSDNDLFPFYPASHELDNIISVAATDHDDNLAPFSNYGATSVHVAAPGIYIYSTKAGDTYQYLSGTSMAAPHVSGLAALILAEDDSLTYRQIKDRILNGVDVISSLNGKALLSGRINANSSINTSVSEPVGPSQLATDPLSSNHIDLSWSDNSSTESGFKIERKAESEATFTHVATVGADVESYGNTGLSEATTYYYRVTAFNSAGNSDYSNDVFATTYPAAPSVLLATAASTSQIDLSWTDNSSGESGFKIEKKTGSGGPYTQIATVSPNATTYSDTGVSPLTTYSYRIRAYNAAGDSVYSNEDDATTPAAVTASESGSSSSCFIAAAGQGTFGADHITPASIILLIGMSGFSVGLFVKRRKNRTQA